MISRAAAKERTRARLLAVARQDIGEVGAANLSLRNIARRSGLASSAVYRHFASRDELLTTLLLESYGKLADALDGVDVAAGWVGRADVLRGWAQANPNEFQLLYGTPVPNYRAPAETVPAAARVAAAFLRVVPEGAAGSASLTAQLVPAAEGLSVTPEALGWTLRQLAHLVGVLTLELGGHFVGTAEPTDQLWADVVASQADG